MGLTSGRKARESFERHQRSESHGEAQLKLESLQAPSVMDKLASQAK